MRTLFTLSLALGLIAACTPYDPDLPPMPFWCGPDEPRCPNGYTCMPAGSGGATPDVCVVAEGDVPDPTNCDDELPLEPNDSITDAYDTPVAMQRTSVVFAAAVCPAGDKDTYGVTITTDGQDLEVLIEYDDSGAELQASIVNMTGIAIANGMVTSPGIKRAYYMNFPVGKVYAQVFGPTTGSETTSGYKLTINVTGP